MMTQPNLPQKILIGFGGFAVALLLITLILTRGGTPRPTPQPKPSPDTELGTGKVEVTYGTDSDDFVYKQTSHYEDGTVHVVKTVYHNRKMPWISPKGNYVLYKYNRPDGTLERERLVMPMTMLGASVYTREIERLYDESGQEPIEERYIREDGTLGVLVDGINKTFTTYRADGKTLRSIQHRVNGELFETYYRLDGQTVWWEFNYSTRRCTIHFDRQGNPYEVEYSHKSLLQGNGYSMGPKSAPIPLCDNAYEREDGTLAYKQTWTVCWDHNLDTTREILTGLEVYAEDGSLATRVTLKAEADSPRFIEKVEEFNPDGSSLVRLYQGAESRLSEETFDADGNSTGKQTFPSSDSYQESIDPRFFQGFSRDFTGLNDDDSHDI